MKKFGKLITVIALILIILILGALGYGYYKKKTLNIQNPIVTMEVENFGTIKMELYPELAPNTVANFIKLANNGYYNGRTFHRVIKDFMIQAGKAEGDTDDSGVKMSQLDTSIEAGSEQDIEYTIPGEMVANGFEKNNMNLVKGTLAMARADYTAYSSSLKDESYNSGSSQFFIMTTDDHTDLSGYYAGFGKVIEGMDVVTKISEVEVKAEEKENTEEGTESDATSTEDTATVEATTDDSTSTEATTEESTDTEEGSSDETTANQEVSTPVQTVKITSVTVDTAGIDYGMPETQEAFNYMKWLYELYGLEYNGE